METFYADLFDIDRSWTAVNPTDPNEWEYYPPQEEYLRMKAWEHNSALFRGRHNDVFSDVQRIYERLERAKVLDSQRNLQDVAAKLYLVANYSGLLSKTCASFLFGEGINVTPENGDEKLQMQINTTIANNELQRLNLMQGRTASAQGYTFYRVRWDKLPDWNEEGVVIDAIPGCNVFPHVMPDNIKVVQGYTIAYKVKHDGKNYLKREVHTPGKVQNTLHLLIGNEIHEEVSLKTIPVLANLQPSLETDYPGLFLQYVPNLESIDEFWGISDYEDIESLQDALNNRLSSVDFILDKHTNPKLIVPHGLMKKDPSTGQLYAIAEDLDVIQVDNPEYARDLPRYVTWDGQLEAAFNEIDKITEYMMLVSQMSPAVFGTSDKHQSAESARALKIRLIQTLAKVNDKRLPFDAALKNILNAGLWLQNKYEKSGSAGIKHEDCDVNIAWNDGIPDDAVETTELHAARVNAGLESQETGVKAVQEIEGDELKKEVQRIQREKGVLIDNTFEN